MLMGQTNLQKNLTLLENIIKVDILSRPYFLNLILLVSFIYFLKHLTNCYKKRKNIENEMNNLETTVIEGVTDKEDKLTTNLSKEEFDSIFKDVVERTTDPDSIKLQDNKLDKMKENIEKVQELIAKYITNILFLVVTLSILFLILILVVPIKIEYYNILFLFIIKIFFWIFLYHDLNQKIINEYDKNKNIYITYSEVLREGINLREIIKIKEENIKKLKNEYKKDKTAFEKEKREHKKLIEEKRELKKLIEENKNLKRK